MTRKVKVSRKDTKIEIECFNLETMAEVYYVLIEGISSLNKPKTNYIT